MCQIGGVPTDHLMHSARWRDEQQNLSPANTDRTIDTIINISSIFIKNTLKSDTDTYYIVIMLAAQLPAASPAAYLATDGSTAAALSLLRILLLITISTFQFKLDLVLLFKLYSYNSIY